MPETLAPIEQHVYSEKEIDDIRWGIRGLQEKMAPPYFIGPSVRRGHPDYQHNKFITNWFTALLGYAEMILSFCRDTQKREEWQERINAIKDPMSMLHDETPPDNKEEDIHEAEAIANEIVAYFHEQLPRSLAA